MPRLLLPVALAALLLAAALDARQPAAGCTEWLACMNDSVHAAQAREFERFHDLAWRAVQFGPPRHPQLLYLLARAQALSGRPGDALVLLDRLAGMGVPTNAATQEDFRSVHAHPRWAGVNARLEHARAAQSNGAAAFRLPERDLVPESLAYDAGGHRFLVGSLYRRKIVEVDPATGRATDFLTSESTGFFGVAGVKIDPARGHLWVCSAALPEMEGFSEAQRGQSRLHLIDLRTREVLATLDPGAGKDSAGQHLLNDLVITRRGDVYVTDSAAGVVHRVRAGSRVLDRFATIGEGLYPNGIALDEDAGALYVASFAGISRIDLDTRNVSLLEAGEVALTGIDGLYYRAGRLLGIQALPGVSRVVEFPLDASGRRATGFRVLEANLPEYDWPTTGTIVGDTFYYIANAQLRSFEAPGRLWSTEKLREPVVRKVQLP